MSTSPHSSNDNDFAGRALEATIRIGVVLLLLIWCIQIILPFIGPVVWGIIIAIAIYPIYRRLRAAMGERHGLAATVFTLIALALLITPIVMLSATTVENAQEISKGLEEGTLKIPPPPENVATWPVVGEKLHQIWGLASVNLEEALNQVKPQLKALGSWLLTAITGTGFGILQFVFSLIIAGVFLAKASGGYQVACAIFTRLAGDRGTELTDLATATVRSVAQGVLGVAIIQAILAGIGLLAVGVPAAGLWALLVLILAVVQLPPILVLLPIIFYVFSTASPTVAVVFMIWSIIVSASDSFLKPLFLGRGMDIPMLVILIGAIGGMMASGIIGLFVGAVVLALGYTLFMAWLDEGKQSLSVQEGSESSPNGKVKTKT